MRLCRGLEKDIIRYEKVRHDLQFLLACKKEGLVPVFAKPKLSIEVDNNTRRGIAKIILKTELKNKHHIRKELKRSITEKCQKLRDALSYFLYGALQYKIRLIVGSRKDKWTRIHNKKLGNLRKNGVSTTTREKTRRPTNVIHNFSSYNLSDKEFEVLSYSLDLYVPGREYGKRTQVEFERFY